MNEEESESQGENETESATDGDSPRDDPFDERSSYFPMVDGAKWVYATENAQSQRGPSEEATIVAEEYPETKTSIFRLTDIEDLNDESSSSVLIRKGSRSLRTHKNVSIGRESILRVDYDPGFIRFDDAWSKETEGFSVELEYTRTASDSLQFGM